MSVNPAKPTPLEDKFILTSDEAAEFFGSFATHDPLLRLLQNACRGWLSVPRVNLIMAMGYRPVDRDQMFLLPPGYA